MENKQELAKIFAKLPESEPRQDLLLDIMCKISKKELMLVKIKLSAFAATFAIFLSYLCVYWQTIWSQIVESDSLQVLSLFYTDSNVVLLNWKNYFLYFLESVPVMPIMVITVGLFIILNLIKLISQELAQKRNYALVRHKHI